MKINKHIAFIMGLVMLTACGHAPSLSVVGKKKITFHSRIIMEQHKNGSLQDHSPLIWLKVITNGEHTTVQIPIYFDEPFTELRK